MEADLVTIAVLRLKLETCQEKQINTIQELEQIAETFVEEKEEQRIFFET